MNKTEVIDFLKRYKLECKKHSDCYNCPLCIGHVAGDCYLKTAFKTLEPYIPVDWNFEGIFYWDEKFINAIRTIYNLMPSICYISRPDDSPVIKLLDVNQKLKVEILHKIDNLTEYIPPKTIYTIGEIFANYD